MGNYTDKRPWEQGGREAILTIVVMVTFFAILSYRYLRANLLVMLAVIALVIFIVYQLLALRSTGVSKIFFVPNRVARGVIKNVLDEKGLPYKSSHNQFDLTDIGLQIRVNRHTGNTKQTNGSRINIGPKTAENSLLIESLCEKLDEAFAPKGLS